MNLGFLILVLIVYVLAVARVVRFINADTLSDPLRVAVERRARDDSRSATERARWSTFGYFLTCPWCVSIWVCAATAWVPLWHAENRVAWYVGVVLAASMLIGVAAPLSADEEIEIVDADAGDQQG
ncbi:DUF1360 domain-containing protein [Mycolicibacterium sp.]|uniref:DUF1360 domain-containing protein n=1 Tax=Mycolicibacterium sp. TaxID=2320850 RepID=UPI00355CA742